MRFSNSFNMFTSFKCTRFISRNFHFKNFLIPYCYFSAESEKFVNKMRNLDRLKTNDEFSHLLYENGKYIMFLKSDMVCLEGNDKLIYKGFKDVEDLKKHGDSTTVFLDIVTEADSDFYLFAVDLDVEAEIDIEQIEVDVDGKFVNLRRSLYFLNQKESQYVTHARGLLNFCKTYKFCCYCGGSLKIKKGGHQKQCASCNIIHYPTLAPIGITLIEDAKHEEVLLVRQQRHPPGMYTCVAGFIEPGESLEENVRREVAEEVGLYVHNVDYCTSQHWALPTSQLTLGCIATCQDKKVDIDVKEILDAKWVNAEELEDAILRVRKIKNLSDMNEKKLWAPPSNAVSHYLMVAWLSRYHNFEISGKS